MEESELHEVLQHTMANINGKAYRTMVGQLFSQNTSPVMDYAYDMDMHKVCMLPKIMFYILIQEIYTKVELLTNHRFYRLNTL